MNSSNQTSVSVEFVSGKDHYNKVIERVASVKKSLWLGTADIKDLYVKAGNKTKPFLGKHPKEAVLSATKKSAYRSFRVLKLPHLYGLQRVMIVQKFLSFI